MKRLGLFVAAAAICSALSSAAYAQNMPMPGFKLGGDDKQMSPEEKEKADALERAARAAQSTVPTQKASDDPWASVRSAEQPAAKTSAVKPKKPKTLTQ